MSIKTRELINKNVICEDLIVGQVKAIVCDPDQWKVTHFEVELTKDAAELILGSKIGGMRNMLAVSAIGKAGKTIDLKVKKGQLKYIYLKAP